MLNFYTIYIQYLEDFIPTVTLKFSYSTSNYLAISVIFLLKKRIINVLGAVEWGCNYKCTSMQSLDCKQFSANSW